MSSTRLILPLAIALVTGSIVFSGCTSTDSPVTPPSDWEGVSPAPSGTIRHYGDIVQVADGQARTFVDVDEDTREPRRLCVLLTDGALYSLPEGTTAYLLPLPQAVDVPPYRHVMLDWSPEGHDPTENYGLPHFDVHFYMLTEDQREAIDGSTGSQDPASQFIPEGYVSTQAVVPQMGVHWIDPTSPEFQPGGVFTHSFAYGFYDGTMAFVEPKMTREFLVDRTVVTQAIKQPAAFQRPGYYAANYSISSDAKKGDMLICLENLAFRGPSDQHATAADARPHP